MRVHWFRAFAIASPIAIALVLLILFAMELTKPATEHMERRDGPQFGEPFIVPGVDLPPTVSADAATLDDEDEVIGVVVNGKPRAYSIKAMKPMRGHVVNDVIDSVPISVSYCDRSNCTAAFTSANRGKPLEIWVAGFNKELMLKSGPTFFWQHTGKLVDPNRAEQTIFDKHEFERAKWKQWRSTYPTTDVYVGTQQ